MVYAGTADLIVRFGEEELIQHTDRDGSGLFDAATLARALADASATIDTYLVGRYSLPLVSAPTVLVGLCCDLARYALYIDAAPDIVKNRHDQALLQLRDIAAGRARLDVVTPTAAPSGLVLLSTGKKLFGRETR